MSKITGRDKRVADWLEKIGIDPKMTRRVVIDIPANGAVWVYIERFGDSSIFEVEPPPELTTAIRVESHPEPVEGPPQADFEEALKIIKGLKVSEQQVIPVTKGRDPVGVKGAEEPPPEWLEEFEAKQQAAIRKWEHPDG